MPQRRDAAIVGIHEYPLRVVGGGVSSLQIKAESAAKALEDAGLEWKDVDAVYDTGGDQGIGGLGISEYFGFKPRVIDTTYVGGSSFEFLANHAARSIAAGQCSVALITYGSTAHSDRRAIGTAGATGLGQATPFNNMEDSWGLTLIGNYAMVKSRHMYQYGTTDEQFAQISVATRRHAMRNPEAVKAMTDLAFVGINEITVNDVIDSRLIAYPLHLLECCMVSDGGGAVLIASPDVARNTRKAPVWIIGTGEATKYRGKRQRHHRQRRGPVRAQRLRRCRCVPLGDRHRDGLRLLQHHRHVHDRGPGLLYEGGRRGLRQRRPPPLRRPQEARH